MGSSGEDVKVKASRFGRRALAWLLATIAIVVLILAAAGVAVDQARDDLADERARLRQLEGRLDAAEGERHRLRRELRRLGVDVDDLEAEPSTSPSSSRSTGSTSTGATSTSPRSSGSTSPETSPTSTRSTSRPRERARARRDPPDEPREGSPSPPPPTCTVDAGIVKVCP